MTVTLILLAYGLGVVVVATRALDRIVCDLGPAEDAIDGSMYAYIAGGVALLWPLALALFGLGHWVQRRGVRDE